MVLGEFSAVDTRVVEDVTGARVPGTEHAGRSRMRSCFRSLGPVALLLAACSGASESDLLGPSTSQNTSPTDPGTNDPNPGPGGGGGGGGEQDAGGGGGQDAGGQDSGGGGQDGGSACTTELEPNDELQSATAFSARFCGKIGTRNDVDIGRFMLPPGATTLSWKQTSANGKIVVRVFANGQVLQNPGDIKVVPGTTYAFEVRLSNSGSSNDRPTYELEVVTK